MVHGREVLLHVQHNTMNNVQQQNKPTRLTLVARVRVLIWIHAIFRPISTEKNKKG